jgi:hypothetical protein
MRFTALGLGLLLVVAMAGCKEKAAEKAPGPQDPKEAFLLLYKQTAERNFEGVWELYSPSMQSQLLSQRAELLKMSADKFKERFGVGKEEMETLEGKAFFVKLFQVAPLPPEIVNPPEGLTVEDATGDSAVVRWEKNDGSRCMQNMVRLDGGWRVEGPSMCKREARANTPTESGTGGVEKAKEPVQVTRPASEE